MKDGVINTRIRVSVRKALLIRWSTAQQPSGQAGERFSRRPSRSRAVVSSASRHGALATTTTSWANAAAVAEQRRRRPLQNAFARKHHAWFFRPGLRQTHIADDERQCAHAPLQASPIRDTLSAGPDGQRDQHSAMPRTISSAAIPPSPAQRRRQAEYPGEGRLITPTTFISAQAMRSGKSRAMTDHA